GYDRTGTLIVALHRDHLGLLQHLRAFLEDRMLSAGWLSAREVREREPALSPQVTGGLLLEDDHQVDPRRLLVGLARAVRARGGTVVGGARVHGIERVGDGAMVRHDQNGRIEDLVVDEVVVTAGAWSGRVGGVEPSPPVRPVRGEILRLRG